MTSIFDKAKAMLSGKADDANDMNHHEHTDLRSAESTPSAVTDDDALSAANAVSDRDALVAANGLGDDDANRTHAAMATANGVGGDDSLPTEDDVRLALKSVYDPEIGISIVDLGLVYGVQIDDDSRNVLIDMTLTTPACPLGPVIKTQAHAVLTNRFPAVNDVDINLVWTPRWDPRIMASEEAKAELGIW